MWTCNVPEPFRNLCWTFRHGPSTQPTADIRFSTKDTLPPVLHTKIPIDVERADHNSNVTYGPTQGRLRVEVDYRNAQRLKSNDFHTHTQLADCCSPPRSHVASRREGRAIVPTLGLERRVPIKGSVGRSYPPVQPLGHSNEGGCGRWCCCCCSCWLSLSLSTNAAVDIWKCC